MTGEPFAARPFDFRRYSEGGQIVLPEDPLFQVRIGWLRPATPRRAFGPKAGPAMVILSLPLMASVVPVPGTLREDQLVAFLHGLQRAEHALDIGLHRLLRIRAYCR
jgi:hypothetical protein